MVGPNNPHNNNALWIDTSNGEKNAVLKYKGNPLVGSGSGSGCDCGIPTIDKNTQPNIVWRQPTEEDLAKLPQGYYYENVADLPEKGKLPLFLVTSNEFGEMHLAVLGYFAARSVENGGGVSVSYKSMNGEVFYVMDDGWSVLSQMGSD